MDRKRWVLLTLICIGLIGASAPGPAINAALPAQGFQGCTGEYFNNTTASGTPYLVRRDPGIDFYWPEGTSPGPGLPVSNYSVRWTCNFYLASGGDYTFSLIADDGMNLLVDGNLLIWAWYAQGPSRYEKTVYLNAGPHIAKVEYYNGVRGGTAKVYSSVPNWNIGGADPVQDCKVRTGITTVYKGPMYPTPHLLYLPEGDYTDLKADEMVTTDYDGEAWLLFDGCMRTYLYRNSELVFSPCRKSENQGGNAVCSQAGVSLWNNDCKGKLRIIETPTAEIVLTGTYVLVGYSAYGETTTVAVLEGEAQVARVLDSNAGVRTLGPVSVVNSQEYWYGVPDNAYLLPGLGAREGSGPIEFLPAVLKQATLDPVLDRITLQVSADNESMPSAWETSSSLEPPMQYSPQDGSVFKGVGGVSGTMNLVELEWLGLADAESYTVEVDCFGCCESGKWCTEVGQTYIFEKGITDTSYAVGTGDVNPKRWRVKANVVRYGASDTVQTPFSEWWIWSYVNP
jgi:hypothetical protein